MNTPLTETTQELRRFAWAMGAALPLLFGLFLPLVFGHALPRWPWALAGLFFLLGLTSPRALSPLYWLWMHLGHLLNYVNTRIILSLVFYLIVLPIGLVKRVFGNDALRRRFEPDKASYRLASVEKKPPQTLERPF